MRTHLTVTLTLTAVALLGLNLPTKHAWAQTDENRAEEIVKNAACNHGLNIDETLKDKIKTGSQRDLGWQVFREGDFYEVEKAFLVNKSMQLRFRWRVNADGSISPVSKRAETLCVE